MPTGKRTPHQPPRRTRFEEGPGPRAYRPLLAYVKSIKGSRDLAQVAWNFINDSLRTTIALQVHACPRLPPHALATSRLPPFHSSRARRCAPPHPTPPTPHAPR